MGQIDKQLWTTSSFFLRITLLKALITSDNTLHIKRAAKRGRAAHTAYMQLVSYLGNLCL